MSHYLEEFGFYEHGRGARYVHPLISGFQFPELVELHESQHAILASMSRLDAVGRVIAPLLDPIMLKGQALKDDQKIKVIKILETIAKNSVFTHEVVATYISFSMFSVYWKQEYIVAREQLSQYYLDALIAGEKAFGVIGRNSDGFGCGFAMACAKVAMAIPIEIAHINLNYSELLIKSIEENCPDERFRTILSGVIPYDQESSIFYKFKSQSEIDETEIENVIAEKFPDIPVILGDLDMFPELFNELKSYFRSEGFSFMDGYTIDPAPEYNIRDSMGASIVLPGISEYECKDLSLKKYDFRISELSDLYNAATKCSRENRNLYCTLWPVNDQSDRIICKAFAGNYNYLSEIQPLSILTTEPQLFQTLSAMPKCAILKIDERCFDYLKPFLPNCGQLSVVLLHDTTPKHFCDVIDTIAQTEECKINILGSEEDGLAACLAYACESKYFIMFPATDLGLKILAVDVVNKFDNVNLVEGEDEERFYQLTGLDKLPMFELFYSAYSVKYLNN